MPSFVLSFLRRFVADDRGNFAITAALLMVPLIAAAGGLVDMVYAVDIQSTLQQASDAAALAGARTPDQPEEIAKATFQSNLPANLPNASMSVKVNEDGSVTVNAKATYQPAFITLVGITSVPVTATSTAISTHSEDKTVTTTKTQTVTHQAPACMLAKASSGGNALLVNSPASVDSGTCEIHVDSNANDAFMFNSGARFDAAKFCIEGTATVRGSTTGSIETDCPAATDTIAGTLPTPFDSACTFNGYNPNGSSVVLTPGVYCGWTNFNGGMTVTLTSGVYVIKDGGWNLNDSTVTGTGVTIYLSGYGASINMNGSVSLDLTAPTEGTYAGILIYQSPSLPSNNFIFNATRGQHLEGLIYLPTQNIQYKSKQKLGTRDAVSVVANTIIIDGETIWRFDPAPLYDMGGTETSTEQLVTTTETVPGTFEAPRLLR